MSHPDKTSPVKPKGLTQQQSDFTSEGAPPPTPNSALNAQALEAASRDLALGSVTPHQAACRQDVVKLLNDALATELVCVLRYKRHHFTAAGQASAKIAQEFMVHARQESLTRRSHAPYDASLQLNDMIRINLMAERVAIECYSQMIDLIGAQDVTTRRLLEDILSEEQAHADELKAWYVA